MKTRKRLRVSNKPDRGLKVMFQCRRLVCWRILFANTKAWACMYILEESCWLVSFGDGAVDRPELGSTPAISCTGFRHVVMQRGMYGICIFGV
jgi:hypothetical protein